MLPPRAPAELRNRIDELLLESEKPISPIIRHSRRRIKVQPNNLHPNILATCHYIYNEATSILYGGANKFKIPLSAAYEFLTSFSRQFRHLRHINTWQDEDNWKQNLSRTLWLVRHAVSLQKFRVELKDSTLVVPSDLAQVLFSCFRVCQEQGGGLMQVWELVFSKGTGTWADADYKMRFVLDKEKDRHEQLKEYWDRTEDEFLKLFKARGPNVGRKKVSRGGRAGKPWKSDKPPIFLR